MYEVCKFFVNSAPSVLFLPLWVVIMIMLNSGMSFVSSKKFSLSLTLGSTLLGIIFSIFWLIYCIHNPQAVVENNISWIGSEGFQPALGTIIDNFSSLIMLFVSIVFFVVEIYSYGYVKNEQNFHRFFILLNLFYFSSAGVILASNLIQMLMFVTLSGVILYLLLGFWYQRKNSTDLAKKMFLPEIAGNVLLLIGTVILIYFSVIFSVVQNDALLSFSLLQYITEILYSMVSDRTFFIAALFLLVPVLIKLGQWPFKCGFLDAVECPAPVSALFQGVMPCLAVMLISRLYPLFILSDKIMSLMVIVGVLSALVFAYAAMSQDNVKKILAYSTSSQMGLVVAGFGAGCCSAALFFLIMHSVAKVLLIFVSGCVIKSVDNEADIKYLGGLRKSMPALAFAFLIGCVSLAGLIFSGFYGQNILFSRIFESDIMFCAAAFLVVVFMGSFALFRAYFFIFEGEKPADTVIEKVSKSMSLALCLMGLGVIFAGSMLKDKFFEFVYFITPAKSDISVNVAVICIFAAFCAVYTAFLLYVMQNSVFMKIKERALSKSNLLYKLSYHGFYIEDFYNFITDKLFFRFCRFLDFVDKYIVNGLAAGVSIMTRIISYFFSKFQNGNIQSYTVYTVLIMAVVTVVVAGIYILGRYAGV